jgi:hypothetical protein
MFRELLKKARGLNASVAAVGVTAAEAAHLALALRKVGCEEVKAELRRDSAIRTWDEFFRANAQNYTVSITEGEQVQILGEQWHRHEQELAGNPMPSEAQFGIFDKVTPENVEALGSFNAINEMIHATFAGRFKRGRTTILSNIGEISRNPEYNKYATISSSSNNSDCLIHSFLTIGCSNFRFLSKEDKNIVARKFRTCVYPSTPQFRAKFATENKQNPLTDHNIELRVLRPGTYLIDNDVTHLCNFLKIQVIIYELKSSTWIINNGNVRGDTINLPCYMMYNNGGHFEGVCLLATPVQFVIPFQVYSLLQGAGEAPHLAVVAPDPKEEEQLAAAIAASLSNSGETAGSSTAAPALAPLNRRKMTRNQERVAAAASKMAGSVLPPLNPRGVAVASEMAGSVLPPLNQGRVATALPHLDLRGLKPSVAPPVAPPVGPQALKPDNRGSLFEPVSAQGQNGLVRALKRRQGAQAREDAREAAARARLLEITREANAANAARKAAEEKASLAELQRLQKEQEQIARNEALARRLGEEQTQIDRNAEFAKTFQGGRKRTRTRRRGRTLKRRSRRRL